MRCSALQCVAACCRSFFEGQQVERSCSEFGVHIRGMRCSVLQRVSACYSVLQHVAVSQQSGRRNTPCNKGPADKTGLFTACLCRLASCFRLASVLLCHLCRRFIFFACR